MRRSEHALPLLMLPRGEQLDGCRAGLPPHEPKLPTSGTQTAKMVRAWFGVHEANGGCVSNSTGDRLWAGKCSDQLRVGRFCSGARSRASGLAVTFGEFPPPRCTLSYPYPWRSLCCAWGSIARSAITDILRFYSSVGPWEVYRQLDHNQHKTASRYAALCSAIQQHLVGGAHARGGGRGRSSAASARTGEEQDVHTSIRILEYGAGIAPGAYYLARPSMCRAALGAAPGASAKPPQQPAFQIQHATVVDAPTEHLYFGAWRLRAELERWRNKHHGGSHKQLSGGRPLPQQRPVEMRAVEVTGEVEVPPAFGPRMYNVIIALTVFEHLPNPLTVAERMLASVLRPAILLFDFISGAEARGPNLAASQRQRMSTLALFLGACDPLRLGNVEITRDTRTAGPSPTISPRDFVMQHMTGNATDAPLLLLCS